MSMASYKGSSRSLQKTHDFNMTLTGKGRFSIRKVSSDALDAVCLHASVS